MDPQSFSDGILLNIFYNSNWKDVINFERVNKRFQSLCRSTYDTYDTRCGNIDIELRIRAFKYGIFEFSILYGNKESIFKFGHLKLKNTLHKIPFGTFSVINLPNFKCSNLLKVDSYEILEMVKTRCSRFDGKVSEEVIRMMGRLPNLSDIYVKGFPGYCFVIDIFERCKENLRKLHLPNIWLNCIDVMLLLVQYPNLDTLEIYPSRTIRHITYLDREDLICYNLFKATNEILDHFILEESSLKDCFECILYIISTMHSKFTLVVNKIPMKVSITRGFYIEGKNKNEYCRCNRSSMLVERSNIKLVAHKRKCKYHGRNSGWFRIVYKED